MREFYVPVIGDTIKEETAHHIVNVRRLKKGDSLSIFDGNGRSAEAEIIFAGKKPPRVEIAIKKRISHPAPKYRIGLFLSLIKPAGLRLALEKCTELGVTSITLIRTARSARIKINVKHLEKIILNACGQCGRKYVPSLDEVKTFLIGIEDWKRDYKEGFVLSEDGSPFKMCKGTREHAVFVGPEGGFTGDELQAAKDSGLAPVSVGDNTLRSETAAMAAVAGCVLGI